MAEEIELLLFSWLTIKYLDKKSVFGTRILRGSQMKK